eukprot:5026779-Lingulodinium_polyedra.AAC.1
MSRLEMSDPGTLASGSAPAARSACWAGAVGRPSVPSAEAALPGPMWTERKGSPALPAPPASLRAL